jgi:hypothetical protein
MREIQYAVDIIVGTIHKGESTWFVSEKDHRRSSERGALLCASRQRQRAFG